MFDLILDSVDDFHTVEVRRLHRIFGGLNTPGFAGGYLFYLHQWTLLKISATVAILDHAAGVRGRCASAASVPAAGGRFECRQR